MKHVKAIEKVSWIIIVIAFLFFIGSFFSFLYPGKIQNFVNIGDINGGVAGSLWALGGVLLFYAALKSQQSSLEIQRREFELQREELKEARMISAEQSKTMQQQRFENTFFLLLKTHKENLESLRINPSNNQLVGRFALEHLWNGFRKGYDKGHSQPEISVITNDFIEYCKAYDHVLNTYCSNVFRTLQIFELLEVDNKYVYINLYASQISQIEKFILFYYGIHAGDSNQLKPLIEKFHLLHMLDEQQLIESQHWKLYDISAYRPVSKPIGPEQIE
ncbi:MAG: hypothetical protein IPL92_17985 [Saprospiraceae bacterium]|nr:hypothetical protein [Candidatus Opimibacter iunctus]